MSGEKFTIAPEDREQLSLLIRDGYINLAGKDPEGNQLYEITPKGEIYFNREEDETTD